MCVCPDRNSKRTRKPEISQLKRSPRINEQVLWLEVAMKHSVRMTEIDTSYKLVHERLQKMKQHIWWASDRYGQAVRIQQLNSLEKTLAQNESYNLDSYLNLTGCHAAREA